MVQIYDPTVDALNIGSVTGTPVTDVGDFQADLTDLEDVAFGKWVVDPDADTLTLYRVDGVTPLIVFDLTPAITTGPGHIARTPQ